MRPPTGTKRGMTGHGKETLSKQDFTWTSPWGPYTSAAHLTTAFARTAAFHLLQVPLTLPKPQCFYSPKHLHSVFSVPEPGHDLAMDLPVRQTCTCLTAGSAHPRQAQLNQHNLPMSLQPPWPSIRAWCHRALQNTCHKPSTEVEGNP